MITRWVLLLALLGIGPVGPRCAAAPTWQSEADTIVQKGLNDRRYPGAVLIIGRAGHRLMAKAYGRQTYDPASPPMKLDTLFDLASCSKVAGTTLAAMLLVEDGKLSLDDPVAKHVPGFEAQGKGAVTVRDLLTHVSGLKAYESFPAVEKERRPDQTHAAALLEHYCHMPLAYVPRTRVLYSCLNMQVAAALVQRVAGETMEDLLRQRVWGPLGMHDTTYRPKGSFLDRCAPTGIRPDGLAIRGEVHDPLAHYHGAETTCPGNAGLFSTAPDLARYAEMVLSGGSWHGRRVLASDTARTMTSVQTPAGVRARRTVGWDIYRSAPYATSLNQETGSLVVGHTGYTGTWMWLDTRSKAYIIFLTNRVFPSPAANGGEGAAISGTQRALADIVLHMLPEYRSLWTAERTSPASAPAEPVRP